MTNINTLIQQFELKQHDEHLLDIYEDQSLIEYQNQRYIKALNKFKSLYNHDENVEIYSAPGRTEIGGNHTDHQHGKVLAASINLDSIGIVSKNDNGIIKVVSDEFDIAPIDLNDLSLKDEEQGTSIALIKGVMHYLKNKGYNIGGFNGYITSDVLVGAGMSSSAAFETIIGTIISGLYNEMKISPVEIAKAGQYAENIYFGKPCGLMDQMASSVGSIIYIDFKEANPYIEKIDVDFSQYEHSLCIVDTLGSHADLTDEYAAIPTEMKTVSDYFNVSVLSELDEQLFYDQLSGLKDTMSHRALLRTIHLFEENKRVVEEVNALKANDFNTFKNVVKASGDSSFKYLQNVYTNKNVHVQNVSLALALTEKFLNHQGVCRVHGGGFAGTIQAFVPNDIVLDYKAFIEGILGKGTCHILKIRKYGGMKVL